MKYVVYILASKKNGVLYIGVTNDIVKRTYQHKCKLADSFSKKYDVTILVYYEIFETPYAAISREKRLKHWPRISKIKLIESVNPEWNDLYLNVARTS